MLHPELRLVPEEDREVVPCPAGMREDVRRVLAQRLAELDVEVMRCRRRALEAGFHGTAQWLADVRVMTRDLASVVKEEA